MPSRPTESALNSRGSGRECWAFVRVSSREQDQEGFSLKSQETRIRAAASRDGNSITRIIKAAETATTSEARAVFQQMVREAERAARSGQLEGLYFDRPDRAFRNFEDLATVEKLHKNSGIRVRFVTPDIDTSTAAGSLMLGVLASVAKFETSGRVDYVKACQRKRVESGLFVGHAPYGYENYRDGGRGLIRVHPEEAATVRLIFGCRSVLT